MTGLKKSKNFQFFFRMGNEHIFQLTRNDDFELRVELDDFDGNRR